MKTHTVVFYFLFLLSQVIVGLSADAASLQLDLDSLH